MAEHELPDGLPPGMGEAYNLGWSHGYTDGLARGKIDERDAIMLRLAENALSVETAVAMVESDGS